MKITEFNRLEWNRMALNIFGQGYEHLANKLIFASKQEEISTQEYDYLMDVYREWLVFNRLPEKSE